MYEDMICENLTADEQGHLRFAGQDTHALAAQYGTPLYLMDEDRIRQRCRTYREAMREAFGENNRVLYASKAASFLQMYRIMKEEGLSVDVVSPGEIHTALRAGFPLENAYYHSNNKSDEDIAYAIEQGIGHFVVDCAEELDAIERLAAARGRVQPVLLRITPGIDPHTYEEVATGKVDSKFGSAIATGQAEQISRQALRLAHVRLDGYHCHVGSQVFDSDVYMRTAEVMLRFLAQMKRALGYEADILDLGGGYGVRYLASQPTIDIRENILAVGAFMKPLCAQLGLKMPTVCMEPGRSIVADAGLTLYTVGMVKRIPGYKNYVSVDGGMTDNPRFALYGAPYTVLPAERLNAPRDMTCSVVGRCCESGDILQNDVRLPQDMRRGELLAVLTTGAYNYSMASNYNRVGRPPVVMLRGGASYVAVRRETLEHLTALDV